MNAVFGGLYFLIQVVFYLFVVMLMLRFFVPLFRIDKHNALVQSIWKISQGVVTPFAAVPKYKNIDTASLVAIWVLTMLKILLLTIFSLGGVNLLMIPILAVFDAAGVALDVFFFSIILVVIYSFFPTPQLAPVCNVAMSIANPILAPIRKALPDTGALDLSPLVALIVIKLIDMVVIGAFV